MKKRFLITQIIVVILLGVCLIGNTYSWSQRPAVKGGYQSTPMTLNYSANINGSQCTGTTHLALKDVTTGGVKRDAEGRIVYNSTAITTLSKRNVAAGDILYFKTEISNVNGNENTAKTNVSLFIDDVKYTPSSTGAKYYIGTSSPVLKHQNYTTTEWIPVVTQFEVIENGSAVIEWYVEFEAAGTFEIGKIILTNN